MTPATTTCPSCGETTEGKFCSHCGAPLAGATCATCGAPLTPGARFCHVCGTPSGTRKPRASLTPWIAGGAAALVLVAAAAYSLGRGAGGAPGAPPAPVQAGGPTDISQMTPRQQAIALFNRVMDASERGLADSVAFFAPMALQVYGMVGPLDNDGRYDVGMIHAVTGNYEGALAQADSLEQLVPGHLLATLLRHTVAEAQGDSAEMQRAYRSFLASYDQEIAAERIEYHAHGRSIEAFLELARRETGTGG